MPKDPDPSKSIISGTKDFETKAQHRWAWKKIQYRERRRQPKKDVRTIEEWLEQSQKKQQDWLEGRVEKQNNLLAKLTGPGRKNPFRTPQQTLSPERNKALHELIRMDYHNLREPLVHVQIGRLQSIDQYNPNADNRKKAEVFLLAIGKALIPQKASESRKGRIPRRGRRRGWFSAANVNYHEIYYKELYWWTWVKHYKIKGYPPEDVAKKVGEVLDVINKYWGNSREPKQLLSGEPPRFIAARRLCEKMNIKARSPRAVLDALHKSL